MLYSSGANVTEKQISRCYSVVCRSWKLLGRQTGFPGFPASSRHIVKDASSNQCFHQKLITMWYRSGCGLNVLTTLCLIKTSWVLNFTFTDAANAEPGLAGLKSLSTSCTFTNIIMH